MTRLTLPKLLPLALLTAVGCFFLLSGTSSAATINVSTNDVASTNNSDCTLREAIENINTQTTGNTDCAAGDGNNDTIIIPSGTIVLATNLPQITKSISIEGQGMGSTVLNAGGLYSGLGAAPAPTDTISISGFTLRAFRDFGFLILQGNFLVDQIEVDGTGATFTSGPGTAGGAFAAQNPTGTPITVDINDVYIHDIDSDTTTLFVIAIFGGGNAPPADDINLTAQNITISDISNTGAILGMAIGFGALNSGLGEGIVTANLSNITIVGLNSTTNSAVGIASLTIGEDKAGDLIANNITIGNITGSSTIFVPGGGISSISSGAHPGVSSSSNIHVSNAIIFNTPSNCSALSLDITGGDPGVSTITSQGGNLSDDNSCSSYFTQPTDQNNVAALAASLLPLADNGGLVPTMALKEGSPAIDSGITVSGLTTDARGALRPQGTAYDSGAYESPYAKPAPVAATLVNSGQNITTILVGGVGLLITAYAFLSRKRIYLVTK